MNQRQHNPRYAADRAFIESLNQLQKTLQPTEPPAVQPMPPANGSNDGAPDPFDLSNFEQAVADIEAFIQTRQQEGER